MRIGQIRGNDINFLPYPENFRYADFGLPLFRLRSPRAFLFITVIPVFLLAANSLHYLTEGKSMKKIIAIVIVLVFCLSFAACGGKSADSGTPVTVTISDAGKLAVAGESVSVTDADGDGTLTLYDVLFCTHDKLCDGGTDAFAAEDGGYGLALTKLWGVENGGSYGYCINNVPADNLTAEVAQGDYVAAYSYSDLTAWSDVYSYFEEIGKDSGSVTLKLTALCFDADWNLEALPVEGAVITVDGAATQFVTDAGGLVTVALSGSEKIISASSETLTIVPPVYTVK